MPTGIRVTRRPDGTREFNTYEQKHSSEEDKTKTMMNNSSSSIIVDNRTIDSSRKFNFKTLEELTSVVENLELASQFLRSEESDCQFCPRGKPGSTKHIHVITSKLTIVNPHYEDKIPPLRAIHCVTCNKKLAYVCSGSSCTNSDACDLYCSDGCQKADWEKHKLKCTKGVSSNHSGNSSNNGINQLDLQNMTIQDKSSTPNISRKLTTTNANNVHCSPRAAAEQLNSSIVVRHVSAQPKQIVESNGLQDNIPQTRQDVNLSNIRQPNTAIRKLIKNIDPFASLPRGLVVPGRSYTTCMLSPDEQSNDRLVVYIPYDNDKLKDILDIVTNIVTEIETSGVSRNIDIGTTHMALSCDDGNWYRAMVVSVLNDEECKVYYIDFGSTEILPKNNLRDISAKGLMLTDTPAIAIKCKFSHKSPSDLLDKALQDEELFNILVESYDEVNKLYVVTLI